MISSYVMIITLASFRLLMMWSGLANNIHGIQATALSTKIVWKNFCPLNMYGLHGVGLSGVTSGSDGELNNTILMNVMRIDGAQWLSIGAGLTAAYRIHFTNIKSAK